ncbi:hypothetical protein [Flavobacterium pectinovorum]|uniref:Uncharacterized protein n=1 Tax=Flavobacterium pectinovorum TaxID=29533 RepID=A0AB36NVV2_9FLAO|nr:hypothetical protein [Flavobacterium pectinovorum]OXB00665.1 hypothetical protein B0A72_19760 [Flavobacterium pectinovorum]SHM42112.1 hypothetical protein SAMN05444387_2451 [Flavobacterium pectinovorum]
MINKQTGIRFLLLVTVLFIFSCKKDISKDCKQIKNGHFFWKHNKIVVSVNRKDSIQIERQLGTNYYHKSSVHWIDDCHYELKILSSNFQVPDSIKKIRNNDILTTEILEVTNDYYIYECTYSSNVSVIDTMWIKK